MEEFKAKKDKEEKDIPRCQPQGQLFKPQNLIESVFVGLSIFSVVVLILANIVSIDSSLKSIIPHFIADNYPQIMHFAHIVLIIYVIFAMKDMLVRIKKIDLDKEKYNRKLGRFLRFNEEISLIDSIKNSINEFEENLLPNFWSEIANEVRRFDNNVRKKVLKSTLNSIISEKGKSNTVRWIEWIKNYINFSNVKKEQIKDTDDINCRIFIANDNITLFYTFWLCIWGGWLLLYIGMFTFGFMEKNISDPLNSKYSVTVHDFLIKDDINNNYYTKTDSSFIVNNKGIDSLFFSDSNYQKNTNYYSIGDIQNKNIIIFSDTIDSKLRIVMGFDSLCQKSTELYFFDWFTASEKKYRIIKDSLIITSDSLTYETLKEENEIKYRALNNFLIHSDTKTLSLIKLCTFFENAIGHFINLFFFLLFFLLSYRYISKKTIDECEKMKFYLHKDEELNRYNKDRKIFNWISGIAVFITLGLILLDYILTVFSNGESGRVIAQLIVSSLCCISMLFLFGQMNNGCLKLPPVAVGVMYFYAAIQLFAPFRQYWIISEQFIPSETFSFLVTTLCFVAKFMVFFIIRWLFTEGKIAYYFINTAFVSRNYPKYEELFAAK